MTKEIEIENLPTYPDEMGEETALEKHDDGTVSSKILGSTDGKDVLREMEARNEASTSDSKPDQVEKEEEKSDTETEEREFDKNPTVLYALVQKKLWNEAIARAKSNPNEARAFILRREKDGRIRWRLLPLHAAIVFKAPEEVIEALLTAYPKAAEEKDDQGMLPLHLAFRNSATEAVVNLLLLAFPQSVDVPDRKNRLPLTLAQSASSPKKELYVKALEKGPSHYAVTALACARDRIVAEQKEIFEAKLEQARKFHEVAISEIEADSEKKQKEIQDTVLEKEKELAKIHENSQVLVDHVASLEAQMNTRSDTERFLATKIAKLEEKVKVGEVHLEERETFWKSAVAELAGQVEKTESLKAETEQTFTEEKAKLKAEIEALSAELDNTKSILSFAQSELAESEAKCAKGEVEWASAQGNVAILESQLKVRMENEHMLASQVSTLASRLAENMKVTREAKDFEKEKQTLKEEYEKKRAMLEGTIELLKNRIKNVAAVMESTREQQLTILDDAIAREEMMAECMESHAKVVSESLQQEKEMQAAKDEMMELIERSFNEAHEKRIMRLKISTDQGQTLSRMNKSRHSVLESAQTVTSNVINALEKDLNLDTLSTELESIEAEKKQKRSKLAESIRLPSVDVDVRDQAEEIKAEEVQTESPAQPKEETTEFIETVLSPKKAVSPIADVSLVDAEDEQRTEVEEKEPEEPTRVTAE